LAACKAGGSGCQVNETRAGKLRRTKSALTKWNPSRKSEELEVWRPLARWDHFREMEDMMHSGERKAEKVCLLASVRGARHRGGEPAWPWALPWSLAAT
jgi:hypothetical protein